MVTARDIVRHKLYIDDFSIWSAERCNLLKLRSHTHPIIRIVATQPDELLRADKFVYCGSPKQRIFGPAATATYCFPPAIYVMGEARQL